MDKRNQSIEALIHELLEQLELKLYGKDTMKNYQRILKNLALYMQQNEIDAYYSEIGNSFIEDYISTHEISISAQKTINTVIGRLNDYYDGKKYFPQRKKPSGKLPENYAVLLENYLSFCKQDGNRAGTIKKKGNSAETF